MSLDKAHHEATRWLQTAFEDLEAAQALLSSSKFSHACFLAQQAGEKALKALWHSLGEDPWGHSIQKLIRELPAENLRDQMIPYLNIAAALDRYYIPTRYPNGLPDLTPGQYYFKEDAEECIHHARSILDFVKKKITGDRI
jgi:HEPN domain-containing protein